MDELREEAGLVTATTLRVQQARGVKTDRMGATRLKVRGFWANATWLPAGLTAPLVLFREPRALRLGNGAHHQNW